MIKVSLVLLDQQVCKVRKELRVTKVQPVPLDLRVYKVLRVTKV